MVNKHMQNCSTSLDIRELQIKTTVRYYILSASMAIAKNIGSKCWHGCKNMMTLIHIHILKEKKVKLLVAQSCLTLCDPMDCSPPGFSVCGILQARILE